MDEVVVSVVIPAYNSARYISDAIESALIQDVALELIVIDDCSKDELGIYMLKYKDDPRVRYMRNPVNMGVAKSRNRGVEEAKGEYIAFLDADDVWKEGKLRKQLALMNEKGTVFSSTAKEIIRADGSSIGHVVPVKEEYTYNDLLAHNSIVTSSVLVKTSVAREFPMSDDDCHEDYIMWLKILEKYTRGCAINEPLVKYRVSYNSKSGRKLKSAIMTYKSYRRMGFGHLKCLRHFVTYAFNGIKKYYPVTIDFLRNRNNVRRVNTK